MENNKYIVYSSHKTASQSIVNLLNTISLHEISNLGLDKLNFINILKKRLLNKNKPNFISIIRDPMSRLKSSFFQLNHDDLKYTKENELNSLIMKNNSLELLDIFLNNIKSNKQLTKESITELEEIFMINIYDNLINMGDYLYYNYELFNLYVFNFEDIKTNKFIQIFKKLFNNDININFIPQNITSKKIYNNKYKEFITYNIPKIYVDIVKETYKKTYNILKYFPIQLSNYIYINYKIYQALNKDLKNYLHKEQDYLNHLINHGVKEKRPTKIYDIYPNFNPIIYKQKYNDLKNLNNIDLELHYINNGFNEKRICD